MKRVLCVYLPRWPLQRLRHGWRERGDKRGNKNLTSPPPLSEAERGDHLFHCAPVAGKAQRQEAETTNPNWSPLPASGRGGGEVEKPLAIVGQRGRLPQVLWFCD